MLLGYGVVLMLSAGMAATTGTVAYSYTSVPYAERSIEFSLGGGRENISFLDRGYEIETCDEASSFFCVHGRNQDFRFAVPQREISRDSSWKLHGVSYTVDGVVALAIWGVSVDVFVIRSEQVSGAYAFLYSVDRGLLGFEVAVDGKEVLFLVEGKCGLNGKDMQYCHQ